MGQAKNRQAELDARGYGFVSDTFVCAECFHDYAIAEFIEETATAHHCDYCGRDSDQEAMAAPLSLVVGFIVDGLERHFASPLEELFWDGADGGWQGQVRDSYEVLWDEVPLAPDSGSLFDDLLDPIREREWCDRDYGLPRPNEVLTWGWQRFSDTVKHRVRYLFQVVDEPIDGTYDSGLEIRSHEMLAELGHVVEDAGLIRSVPRGATLFRARIHSAAIELSVARDLGIAPAAKAATSRMSPAGIPLFYGAVEQATAVVEIRGPHDGAGQVASVAAFRTTRELRLVDLVSLPAVPSIFDCRHQSQRPGLLFARHFAEDVSHEIERDGREHVEYVPTQVATEYFRRVFRTVDGHSVDGILYRSARQPGGTCCVLFLTGEHIADEEDTTAAGTWLVLPHGSVTRIDL